MNNTSKFQIESNTPALKPFDGMTCTRILDADGSESIVAEFFDNFVDGTKHTPLHVARFVNAEPMEQLLRSAVQDWPQFDKDDDVSGADLVAWFAQFRESAKAVLADVDAVIQEPFSDTQQPKAALPASQLPQRSYENAFPNFGVMDVAIPLDFNDDSSSNNVCPTFARKLLQGACIIWVDYVDFEKRESLDETRFTAQVLGTPGTDALLSTDSWSEVLHWARVEIIKDEILHDVRNRIVPADVENFAGLYHHRDANAYGNFCDESVFPDGWTADGHMTDEHVTFVNTCFEAVDAWITSGGLRAAVTQAGIDAWYEVSNHNPQEGCSSSTSKSNCLIKALPSSSNAQGEYLPGAEVCEVGTVMMQDIVGDYDVPSDVPEWAWIEQHASYEHMSNGQNGIWEFVFNLSVVTQNPDCEVPDRLKSVITAAISKNLSYLIFHQGT